MRLAKSLLAVLLGVLVLGSAHAEDFHVGGSWGEAKFSIAGDGSTVGGSDSGYKLFGGYRVIRWFGVEAAFTDLLDGKESGPGLDVELSIRYASIAAVGVLPAHPRISLWAKLEAAYWRSDLLFRTRDTMTAPNQSGVDIGWGVGADWFILRRFGIRTEWERFDFGRVQDLEYLSVGIIVKL